MKPISAFTLTLVLLFAAHISVAQTQEQAQNSLFGSLWSNILDFFGLTNDYNQANTTNNTKDVLDPEQLLNSSRENDVLSDAVLDQQYQKQVSGNDNFACLPSTRHGGEQFLIRYKCPYGTQLINSSFDAKGDYGVHLVQESSGKEFIDCQSKIANTIQRFECMIKTSSPKIEHFALTPPNPDPGQTVELKVKVDNVQKCILTNSDLSIRKAGTDFELAFTAKQNDFFVLKCIDDTGLTFNNKLTY